MRVLLFVIISGVLFLGCSPKSNFNSDDQRFKSLMDGETVEVTDDQSLIETMEIGEDSQDGGLGSNGTNTGDDGLGNNDMGSNNSDGGMGSNNNGNGMTGRDGSNANNDDGAHGGGDAMNFWQMIDRVMRGNCNDKDKKNKDGQVTKHNDDDEDEEEGDQGYSANSCKDRLMKQGQSGKFEGMKTCPSEIQISKEMFDAISCSSEGQRKVSICHFPNGDASKKMTKCLPIPALRAHLRQHKGDSPHLGHADFAGPCTDEEGNAMAPQSEQNRGDQSEDY